jgi:hypothetical protein
MLAVDDSLRAAIRDGGRNDEVRTLARQNGMKMMAEYALDHACSGLTTLEELQRVVPFEHNAASLCETCARELSPAFAYCPYCGQKQSRWGVEKARVTTLVEEGAGKP